MTSFGNNCFCFQQSFPYIALSLLRGATAVTVQLFATNYIALTSKTSYIDLKVLSLQRELLYIFAVNKCHLAMVENFELFRDPSMFVVDTVFALIRYE